MKGLKSFFLLEEKAPVTILNFFENPLSEAYLWFFHSQAINMQILRIEGKNKSVIEVLDVLEHTANMVEEKRACCFLPVSVRTIIRKHETDGNMSAVQIVNFKEEIFEFYLTLSEYLNKWMKPLQVFTVFSWMTLKNKPEHLC